ncbi:hypothetical protein ZIOFF_006433 [Zingiber officinale]|uniref:Uncharacterized protein n=1 Tax=Zingiber officinale TaxID=94328 RepID=A0A8J5HY75_ZINOF|nr:hypothetical protein ZIOFF_006433 [Zingiber officinale]
MASLTWFSVSSPRKVIPNNQAFKWRSSKLPRQVQKPILRRKCLTLCSSNLFPWEASPPYATTEDGDGIIKGSNIVEPIDADDKLGIPIFQGEEEAIIDMKSQPPTLQQPLKWPMWLLGPSVLLATGMAPTLWTRLSFQHGSNLVSSHGRCLRTTSYKQPRTEDPSAGCIQVLEASVESAGPSSSFNTTLCISEGLSRTTSLVHLVCCAARAVPSAAFCADADGDAHMALEVTGVDSDTPSLRGLQGAAADERAQIGWGDRFPCMGDRKHPWVGVMVGVDSWSSANECCLIEEIVRVLQIINGGREAFCDTLLAVAPVADWDELRREARRIEGNLDVRLSSYAKLGGGIPSFPRPFLVLHVIIVVDSRRSLGSENPASDSHWKLMEIEMLLARLTEVNEAMSRCAAASTTTTSMAQKLIRDRNILHELTQVEFHDVV